MRAAAILGPGCSEKDLKPFQTMPGVSWQVGLPSSPHECDVIVLCGGDGTIHRYLGQLVELQIPVLIVPWGSGNDFARGLNLLRGKGTLNAWRDLASGAGATRTIDVGLITELGSPSASGREHYYATIAGLGLDGEVARRANVLPRWLRGNGGYVLSLLPALARFAALPMRIQADNSGASLNGFKPTTLAAFANVSTFGGGMRIAPQAKPDDGMLDVRVVGDINRFKLFCLFPTVYFGRHVGMDKVEYSRASQVRVETERPLEVYADGEFVCQTPVEITLKPGALRVVVPTRQS